MSRIEPDSPAHGIRVIRATPLLREHATNVGVRGLFPTRTDPDAVGLSWMESDSPGAGRIFRHRPDRQAGSKAASSRRTAGSSTDGTERSGAALSRRSPKPFPAPPVGRLAHGESAGCSRPSLGGLGTRAGARAGPCPDRLGRCRPGSMRLDDGAFHLGMDYKEKNTNMQEKTSIMLQAPPRPVRGVGMDCQAVGESHG